MPISIVSAPPQTTQKSALETSGASEDTGSSIDFANLLLGQLTQTSAGAGMPESPDTDSAGHENLSDSALLNDPLALLAVLSQTPEDRREATDLLRHPSSDLTLTGKSTTPTIATVTENTTSAEATDISARSSSLLPTPPSLDDDQKAAKFAAAAFAASGDRLAPTTAKTTEPLTGTIETAPPSTSGIATNPAGTPANRQDPPPLAVPTPLHDRGWSNDFSQKVVWLATSHKQAAELTLTPPQMGSIEISLKIDNSTSSATATFVSTNADVRDTIEAALPRLREMLAGVGIDLGQANVSAESFRQQASSQGDGTGNASRSTGDTAILAPESALTAQASGSGVIGSGRGLVDIFA